MGPVLRSSRHHDRGPVSRIHWGKSSGKCDTLGIFVLRCDSKAPWRTDRHGDLMKKMRTETSYEYTPADVPAWLQLVTECVATKNRLSNCSGYSPLQRVFGSAHRLPGDLISDDQCRCPAGRPVHAAILGLKPRTYEGCRFPHAIPQGFQCLDSVLGLVCH